MTISNDFPGLSPAAAARVAAVRRIAVEVTGPAAALVDRDARYPKETMAALAKENLLSAYVPEKFGGSGASIVELGAMCEALGQRCGSSAMVFGMHLIQVACLVRHGSETPFFQEYLRGIVKSQRVIASVTSEAGVGGSVRTSISPIERDVDGTCHFKKDGTVVSYADAADDLLVTVRRAPDSVAGDQAMVFVRKDQCKLELTGTWDTMGMRGTCSPGYVVSARFGEEQIIPAPFADINAHTMVPWAHILWSSGWLGVATDAVNRARQFVKETAKRMGNTPPTAARLSEASATLQTLRVQVREAARRYDEVSRGPKGGAEDLSSVSYAIQLNHLKLAASRIAADVCMQALRITGTSGYRNDSPFSVTRHLRDSLSAQLMIGNERIHAMNGPLHLMYKDEAL